MRGEKKKQKGKSRARRVLLLVSSRERPTARLARLSGGLAPLHSVRPGAVAWGRAGSVPAAGSTREGSDSIRSPPGPTGWAPAGQFRPVGSSLCCARPLAARVLGSGGPVRASACLASSVPTPRSGSGSGSPTLVAGRRWWTRSMGPGDTRTDHEIVHRVFFFCLKKEPRGAPSISRLKSGKSAPGLPASLPLAFSC